MKLYCSLTSPYARKARVMILEKELERRVSVEVIDTAKDATLLRAVNPLGKIPALVIETGQCVYDSPVICEFLDTLSAVAPAIPDSGPERWRVLTDQALADGLMDAAVGMIINKRYSGADTPEALVERNMDLIHRALNEMETRVTEMEERLDLGQIAFVCAIDYLELRYADFDWREMRPSLALWHETLSRRPSIAATRPS